MNNNTTAQKTKSPNARSGVTSLNSLGDDSCNLKETFK
jgi:hypothetical protein